MTIGTEGITIKCSCESKLLITYYLFIVIEVIFGFILYINMMYLVFVQYILFLYINLLYGLYIELTYHVANTCLCDM